MRILPSLLLTICVVALASCEILDPSPEATISGPAPVDTTDATTVEKVYFNECAFCHGLNGDPIGATTGDLKDFKGSYEEFDMVLLDGPGAMPKFSYSRIDTAMRQELYEYLRTFE